MSLTSIIILHLTLLLSSSVVGKPATVTVFSQCLLLWKLIAM